MKMDFLGYVLSLKSIRPKSKMVQTIKEWQNPMMVKGIQSFLVLANFYRKFIARFSTLTKPFTNPLNNVVIRMARGT
jgi:hypothetical protein